MSIGGMGGRGSCRRRGNESEGENNRSKRFGSVRRGRSRRVGWLEVGFREER